MNSRHNNRGHGSQDNLYSMIRVLSGRSSGLRICHINAQSLNKKIDEFRFIFERSNVDIICVSETWFQPDVSDNIYKLDGYRIFRSDRKTHGGGVAVYIRLQICNQFRCTILDEHVNLTNIEHLFIEIRNKDRKLFLGTIYRPNKNIDIEPLLGYLSSRTLCYSDIILAGDFNANIITDMELMFGMSAIGLFLVNQTFPTHFTSTSSTLIDLYFVGDRAKILLYEQLSASVFSKHDLIFLSYDFIITTEEVTIHYKDFRNIDTLSLEAELITVPWNDIYYMPSVDEQTTFLHNNIQYFYEKYVATKSRRIKSLDKPWFSNEIKRLIDDRNQAYERWKRFRTPELHYFFKICRKKVNAKIRMEKIKYYGTKFNSAISSKKKWYEIRNMDVISKNNAADHISDVNQLNREFLNIQMPTPDINFYSDVTQQTYGFEFANITFEDVAKAFQDIRSESVGYDEMHPKFVKIILKYILKHITHHFNTIIMKSEYPSMWKISKIIPIPKPDKSYRPIAILPYLSKVFERLMHTQMGRYLYDNNLLTNKQSGFRPKHSCVTALIDVCEDLRSKLDKNMISFLILLDHSKAFDTVDHTILCHKLKNMYNFSTTATKLLSSYLCNRFQSVHIGHYKSEICAINRGVPQGSILGPLLYAVYSNDLPSQISHCDIHMYADDVQLYISCLPSDVNDCIYKINSDLNNVYKWASANGLCINAGKSKCILIGGKTSTITFPIPPLLVGDSVIEIVDQAKNLGVIFNKQLDWSNHINAVCGKIHIKLRNLWKSQYFTPFTIRMLLAKTYLLPTLMYGCEIFAGLDFVTKRKINVAFNNIARYVFKQKRFSNISHFSKLIYNLSFDNLLQYRILTMLHKIIYTRQPEYLFTKLNFSRSNRGNKINAIRYNRLISERHFFIVSIRLWNLLPPNIQMLSNAEQFKRAIFRHLS